MSEDTKAVENLIADTETGKKAALMKLPLGQRLLKAGYKVVTEEDLGKRFCIGKLNKALVEEKIKKEWGHKKIVKTEWMHSAEVRIYYREFLVGTIWSLGTIYSYVTLTKRHYLEHEDLDYYTNDKIPERCLKSIEAARDLGVKEFRVVYPVFGAAPSKDPVIVGVIEEVFSDKSFNAKWFEIDMWE